MNSKLKAILGVDLGTSNTAAAVGCGEQVHVVAPPEGYSGYGPTIPSYVSYAMDGSLLHVGRRAQELHRQAPGQVIRHAKRLLGMTHDQLQAQLADGNRLVAELDGRIEACSDGSFRIRAGNCSHAPADVIAAILRKVRSDARVTLRQRFGESATFAEARVGVPATFNDDTRNKLRAVAEQELDLPVRLVEEPLAALIGWGALSAEEGCPERLVLVVDMGAGTTDIVVARVNAEGMKVLRSHGDGRLGGMDMDETLFRWVCDQDLTSPTLRQLHGEGKLTGDVAGRLMAAIEEAKLVCSMDTTGFAFIAQRLALEDDTHKSVNLTLLRSELPTILSAEIKRLQDAVSSTLEALGQPADEGPTDQAKEQLPRPVVDSIDQVLVIGGPAQADYVRRAVAGVFEGRPELQKELNGLEAPTFNPAEVVARGTALADFRWETLVPCDIGVFSWYHGYQRIIEAGQPYEGRHTAILEGVQFPAGLAQVLLLRNAPSEEGVASCPVSVYHLPTTGEPVNLMLTWSSDGVNLQVEHDSVRTGWPPAAWSARFDTFIGRTWQLLVDGSSEQTVPPPDEEDLASILEHGWDRLLDLIEAALGPQALERISERTQDAENRLEPQARCALEQVLRTAYASGTPLAAAGDVLEVWPNPSVDLLKAALVEIDTVVGNTPELRDIVSPIWAWADRRLAKQSDGGEC